MAAPYRFLALSKHFLTSSGFFATAQTSFSLIAPFSGPKSIATGIPFSPSPLGKDVSLQNADWGSQPNLTKIKRFEIKVRLLPLLSRRIEIKRLILIKPEILFETDISGKSNLAFETAKKQNLTKGRDETKAAGNWKLSALIFNELQIEKGRITYIDHKMKKTYVATVDNLMASASSGESPTKLKLKGAYNDTSFEVTGTLCPLTAFINPGKAWPVNLAVKTGSATLTLEGTVKDPLTRRGIESNFTLKGKTWQASKNSPARGTISGDPSMSPVESRILPVMPIRSPTSRSYRVKTISEDRLS